MLYQQPHGTRGGWEEGFDRNTAEGKGQKERCEEARRSGEETRCTEREGTYSGLTPDWAIVWDLGVVRRCS